MVLFSAEVMVILPLLLQAKETMAVEQLNIPLVAVAVLVAPVTILTILRTPVGVAPEGLQLLLATLLIMLAGVLAVEILLALRPAV
jgi:hypothetical protein